MRASALTALVALALAGCAASATEPGGSSSGSIALASVDVAAGGVLPDWSTASAFAGQCAGANLSPALAWYEAPGESVTFALTMTDQSAHDFVHWIHANIPADTTSIGRGASATLAGIAGTTDAGTTGYFGPCPPGPDHRYVFTVWALDAPLDLPVGFRFADFVSAATGHVLATGTLAAVRSGPA